MIQASPTVTSEDNCSQLDWTSKSATASKTNTEFGEKTTEPPPKPPKNSMSTITDLSRTKSVLSTRSVDYVGFANLPNQVFRRCIKNGFEFTLMVVGKMN
jgi:hypothetical protein